MASRSSDFDDFLIPKKPKTINRKRCLFCQCKKADEEPKTASPSGIETVLSTSQLKNDGISNLLETTEAILWHGYCYSSYTSKRNLSFLDNTQICDIDNSKDKLPLRELNRSSRSNVSKINWSLCMFCQKVKNKGVKALGNVSSVDACNSIREAAKVREDQAMLINITGVDLIAVKAQYHINCRSSYVSKSNLKHQAVKDGEDCTGEDCELYEKSFRELVEEIQAGIAKGRAYDMSDLRDRFQEKLISNGYDNPNVSVKYRSEKLKKRLINHFQDSIVFHKQSDPSKPELVYSSLLSVQDIINAAAESFKSESNASNIKKETERVAPANVLYQAAQILKTDIKESEGISIKPLAVDDITLEKGKQVIPDRLYKFLYWLTTNQNDPQEDDLDSPLCTKTDEERRVLMIGQDIVYFSTRSRVKTPKHVGLAMTLHHLTGSKQLVRLLHKMGHCSSYDDVEIINTSLAREISAQSEEHGVVVPSNISPGVFAQFAADNNDLNEETLDGKHTTHATTIVVFQRRPFGPKLPPKVIADHSTKRRSLDKVPTQTIHDFGVRGKRPQVTKYLGTISEVDFAPRNVDSACMDRHDFAWFLLRLSKGTSLLSPDEYVDKPQDIPSWSAWNAMISAQVSPRTNIGYCPMIAGSPTEYSTIYTVMKTVQAISASLGQTTSVVTFDMAIYSKAKEIQWRHDNEFKHLVIRLGGFHIALNFLSVIGKKFKESGIEDLLIESGLYGSATTAALLNGKSYNRGVRAHKLVMEALLRLQWKAFCDWLEKTSNIQRREGLKIDEILMKIRKCKESLAGEQLQNRLRELCESLEEIQLLLHTFCKQSTSQLFLFWNSYIEMVVLLLRFIKAEREGNWELHLRCTAEMLPHFFSMDKTNYSRWLPIYLADMHRLEETSPEVYQEFVMGNHAVSRSSQPFSQIWTDMALEQSVNRDSKTKGGIVGISQKEGTLERWFVTAHERAAVTTATKVMCGIVNEDEGVKHKEGGRARIARDEEDVNKLVSTLETLMVNPFLSEDETAPLSNLASGVVMPNETTTRLLDAEKLGITEIKFFLDKRINSNSVGFWDTLPRMKILTFESMTRNLQVKASDEKLITVNADRTLFARLLIASSSRNIDLREVLKYELSPVPCALAHTDGTLRKSNKSVLLAALEDTVEVLPRLPCENLGTAHIVDGMAVVQMVKSAGARTFGEMASRYYDTVTASLGRNNCDRVDVVFDRYDENSIKESERRRRGSSTGYEVSIANGNQPVPKKWSAYISNPTNKTRLQHFLAQIWTEMGEKQMRPGQQLVLAGCFTDPQDAIVIQRGVSRPLDLLKSDQEEADTRMMLHAADCSRLHSRVVIQSPDTDVAVLAVFVMTSLSCEQLWMKTGVRDKLRYIPIHEVASNLGPDVCNLLPAFHSLTGCDTTSGPYMIGKKKSFKRLRDNTSKYDALGLLGEDTAIPIEVSSVAEQFICSLYSTSERAGTTADSVRYWMFCQRRQKNEGLPPTSNSLQHHIARANYQTIVWKRCLKAMQQLPSPSGNGWELSQQMGLKPVLMSQEAAPQGLAELTVCTCKKSACKSNLHCVCQSCDMPCTEACGCMADDSCQNPHNQFDDDSSSDDE